jgi:hypothetical protein
MFRRDVDSASRPNRETRTGKGPSAFIADAGLMAIRHIPPPP